MSLEHSPQRELLSGYLDKPGLAGEFKVTTRTIDRWMDEPDGIPHVRIGNKTFFSVEAIRDWIASREVQRNVRRKRRTA